MDSGKKEQWREHPRSRGVWLECGEAGPANADVISHPQ